MLFVECQEADGFVYPRRWVQYQLEEDLVTEASIQDLIINGIPTGE